MKLSRLELLILAGILVMVCLAASIGVGVVYYSYNIRPVVQAAPAPPLVAPSQTEVLSPSSPIANAPPTTLPPSPQPTSTVAEPPTPVPTATPVLGTFNNPIPLGVPYGFPGLGSLTVTSTQWLPGQPGLAIALLRFYCERPPGQICDTGHFMFDAVGSSGTGYRREFDSAIPNPSFGDIFDGDTYGGATEIGNVGFLVTNPEQSLLMKVQLFLRIEDPDIYFRLSP